LTPLDSQAKALPGNGKRTLHSKFVPWLLTRTTLLLPLAISLTPWICIATYSTFLHNASAQELEGAYYVYAFVGALSFVLTGPVTGIVLGNFRRHGTMKNGWIVGGAFLLLSMPTLVFQVFLYHISILTPFVGPPLTEDEVPRFFASAAALAGSVYTFYFAILYFLAKRGFRDLVLGGMLLSFGSFAIILTRL
jgi:hypothetical protein